MRDIIEIRHEAAEMLDLAGMIAGGQRLLDEDEAYIIGHVLLKLAKISMQLATDLEELDIGKPLA